MIEESGENWWYESGVTPPSSFQVMTLHTHHETTSELRHQQKAAKRRHKRMTREKPPFGFAAAATPGKRKAST